MDEVWIYQVSTKEQNIDRQLTAIFERGIAMNKIYIDKASGKDFDRKKYKSLLGNLKQVSRLILNP